MDLEKYCQIIKETEYMLDNYLPSGILPNIKFFCKNELKKILKRGYSNKDPFNWPAGLLLRGLMDAVDCLESSTFWENDERIIVIINDIIAHIEEYLAPFVKNVSLDNNLAQGENFLKLYVLDDAITGEVFLWLYARTNNVKYKMAAEAIYTYLLKHKTDANKSFVYREVQNNGHILADMVGMVCPFLAEYGIMFDDPDAVYICEDQLINYIDNGFDCITMLPYHGYEIIKSSNRELTDENGIINYGIIGWGRAVGWILRGEAYYLKALANDRDINKTLTKNYIKIKENFIKLCNEVIKYQRKDDMFSWQLQALNGPVDISGSAMIYDAVLEALELGIFDLDNFKGNIEEISAKVVSSVLYYVKDGKVTNVLSECLGFGMHPQIYGSYPWGQGTTLSMLAKYF